MIGIVSMCKMYARNNSFLSKAKFARLRGYEILGFRYGMAIHNTTFSTVYLVVIPRNE
jgi:hypothetical protein